MVTVNKKINLPTFLTGSLIGSLVGASVVLLSTPKSGKQFRQDLNLSSKKAIEKSNDIKQEIQQLSTQQSNTLANNSSKLIDNTFIRINKFINNLNEMIKMAGTVVEFIMETTHKTKELYDDILNKASVLGRDVLETSTEIKEEVVEQTRMISEDAKSKSKKIKKEVKDFKDESLHEIKDLKETKKLEIEENQKLNEQDDSAK